jgi:twitching motility protein PilT
MRVDQILGQAVIKGASDVHIATGNPVMLRIDGVLVPLNDELLEIDETKSIAKHVIPAHKYAEFESKGQIDISYRIPGHSSYRVNVYRYSSKFGMAFRIINEKIPTIKELELPEGIAKAATYTAGLILVTGPTGCGKSTTIASILDAINENQRKHILTIEDPIEYLHRNKKCIITQREVGRDCDSFTDALRAGLRQDPDIIMVGEMRDLETISTAVTAAETGHLVFGTLHTRNTYQTIERMIDVFPPSHQQQIRIQLANSLMAIFSQRLIPRRGGTGRVASVESMVVTPAIRNLMRENKVHQLQSFIQTGQRAGMQTFDDNLKALYLSKTIDRETLLEYAVDRENMQRSLF